jgi:predicted RNA-binding protein with PUA-like domain
LPLSEIKTAEELKDFDLVRLPRLSVMPVAEGFWRKLQDMMSF